MACECTHGSTWLSLSALVEVMAISPPGVGALCSSFPSVESHAFHLTCPPARPPSCPRCSGASPDARFQGRTAAEVAEANGFPDTASLIRLHMMEHQQGSLESGGGGADVHAPPATVDSGAAGLDVSRCAGQALVG